MSQSAGFDLRRTAAGGSRGDVRLAVQATKLAAREGEKRKAQDRE
jgi:hypothetical protein